jgi:hypothetical protein
VGKLRNDLTHGIRKLLKDSVLELVFVAVADLKNKVKASFLQVGPIGS